jgi:hypothetical protein
MGRRGAGDSMVQLDLQNITGTSVDADGYPQAQHNEDGEQGGPALQVVGPLGFISMPLDPVMDNDGVEPDPAQSAMSLRMTQGSRGFSFPLMDPREIALIPLPLPGERLWHSAFGSFVRHHADGSVSIATTDAGGAPTDSSGNQAQSIALRLTPTGRECFGPFGRENFDAMSWRLTHAGGTRVAFGAVSGLPGPMSGGQSYARIEAGIIELNGQAVSIGPGDSPHQTVAWALPLVTILQQIGTTMEAIVVAMGTITTASPGAAAATSVTPLIVSLQAALAAALETISTTVALG